MYAVVYINGHQYKVAPNDTIIIDRIVGDKGAQVQFSTALLIADGPNITVGTPFVPDTQVIATITDHIQGEKIRVSRFKAKSRYRKTIGFRAQQTVLTINSIEKTTASKSTPKKVVTPRKSIKKA